ncbi:hypothetical protein RRG08_013570 [Elysia crispata]|uniref:Uncharacterized protein n=1 Tax=Elysia crispata TaxID=231223 RepID=A0AAE1CQB0_9GAST|nr:hypothetical protein RRG08_013570 [Elysia crispata]
MVTIHWMLSVPIYNINLFQVSLSGVTAIFRSKAQSIGKFLMKPCEPQPSKNTSHHIFPRTNPTARSVLPSTKSPEANPVTVTSKTSVSRQTAVRKTHTVDVLAQSTACLFSAGF